MPSRFQSLALAILLLLPAGRAAAQVVRDGTLGPGSGVQPSGPEYRISPAMGEAVGDNLFHSFAELSFRKPESLHFEGARFAAILARVTGGDVSEIDGTLGADTSLFLLNPAGIVFGPEAELDVDGAFSASTGDGFELGGGAGFFPADPAAPAILVSAPVTDFGFLGAAAGDIRVEGAALEVPPGETLRLHARSLDLEPFSALTARGGRIHLRGEDAVSVHGSLVSVETAASATPGPTAALVEGGDVFVDGEILASDPRVGGGVSGRIEIRARDRLEVAPDALLIATGRDGAGLQAVSLESGGDLRIGDGADLSVDSLGSGPGGRIHLIAGGTIALESAIVTASSRAEPAAGGHIEVRGRNVDLGFARLGADGREREGGSISIRADEDVRFGSFVRADGAQGGRVEIEAGGTVSSTSSAAITAEGTRGGRIRVAGEDVRLEGDVLARGFGGSGGEIGVEASRDAELEFVSAGALGGAGRGGRVELSAGEVLKASVVDASGAGADPAGEVRLSAGRELPFDGLVTAVGGSAGGDGGRVVLQSAGRALVDGRIWARGRSGGAGGSIEVEGAFVDVTRVLDDTSGAPAVVTVTRTAPVDGVVRDGSAGAAPAGVVPGGTAPSGERATYLITEELGSRLGTEHLLHSFSRLDVRVGELAWFTASPEVLNLLLRVTGGDGSDLEGRVEAPPGTVLFVLDPRGVSVGERARLSPEASLQVATADRVRFSDGSVLAVGEATAPPVLALGAAVADLGFEAANTAPIEVRAELSSPEPVFRRFEGAGPLSFEGAEIVLEGGGEIVAESAGSVLVARSELESDASGPTGAGRIAIRGGQLTLTDAELRADSGTASGRILLSADGDLRVEGGRFQADGPGGGQIEVAAGGSLVLANRVDLRADGNRNGPGRAIRLRGDAGIVVENAEIDADDREFGEIRVESARGGIELLRAQLEVGDGGAIEVMGESVEVGPDARLEASSGRIELAAAGDLGVDGRLEASGELPLGIAIDAGGDVRIGQDGRLATIGDTAGGPVTVRAGGALRMDGEIVAESDGPGDGGAVLLEGRRVSGLGSVSVASFGSGGPGTLEVRSDEPSEGVVRDGSVGALPAGRVAGGLAPDGEPVTFLISPELGEQWGGSLLHSFERFSLRFDESAAFTGPASVVAVIARVTGGRVSELGGKLRLTIPGAALFLVNPAGVVTGARFDLDIPGALHLGAADGVGFDDGSVLDAVAAPAPALLALPVELVIGGASGDLRILQGTVRAENAETLELVAAGRLETGAFTSIGTAGSLLVRAGEIQAGESSRIAGGSVSLEAEGGLALDELAQVSASRFRQAAGSVAIRAGTVALDELARVEASGSTGGSVSIRADGDIALGPGAALRADGDRDGGRVEVVSGGVLSGAGRPSRPGVFSATGGSSGSGAGGKVSLQADGGVDLPGRDIAGSPSNQILVPGSDAGGSVQLESPASVGYRGVIDVRGTGPGANAGSVRVEGGDVELNVELEAQAELGVAGGDVQIRGDDVLLRGEIDTEAGVGGAVTVDARGALDSAARIRTRGLLGAGDIELVAGGDALVRGELLAENRLLGDGGAVAVRAGADLTLTRDVRTDSASATGGTILLTAGGDLLLLQGDLFSIGSSGGDITLRAGGNVETEGNVDVITSGSSGRSGRLRVEAGRDLRLGEFGLLDTRPRSPSMADGGEMHLAAGQLARIEGVAWTSASNGRSGDLSVEAARIEVTGSLRSLVAGNGQGGNLTLLAPDYVRIEGSDVVGGGLVASGTSALSPGGVGGDTLVRTGRFETLGSGQLSSSSTLGQSGNVTVIADEAIHLSNEGGAPIDFAAITRGNNRTGGVYAASSASDGGRILLSAPDVEIRDGAFVAATVLVQGEAGGVRVEGERIRVLSGAAVDGSVILSGQGGSIELEAGESIRIEGSDATGARSRVRAAALGVGRGGRVALAAPLVVVDEGAVSTASFDVDVGPAQIGPGFSGQVSVDADRVEVRGGGRIDSSSFGGGPGGNVAVSAGEVLVSGAGSEIIAKAAGAGRGGDVRIEAERLRIEDGGAISVESKAGLGAARGVFVEFEEVPDVLAGASIPIPAVATGEAGSLVAVAPDVVLDGGALRSSAPDADGGDVDVRAVSVRLSRGAAIEADVGDGRGGSIRIEADTFEADASRVTTDATGGVSGKLEVDAARVVLEDSVVRANVVDGQGGDVRITADRVLLTDGSVVAARASGVGNAGSIRVEGRETVELLDAAISAEATGGLGGNVEVLAQERIELRDSEITANVGSGSGGNIRIDPEFVILENSRIVAQAGDGRGGRIGIRADVFLSDPASEVSASAGNPQLSGSVEIDSPEVDLVGDLSQLPENVIAVAGLLRERCRARREGRAAGSFVVVGRDGLPPSPDGLLPAALDATGAGARAGAAVSLPPARAQLWRCGASAGVASARTSPRSAASGRK